MLSRHKKSAFHEQERGFPSSRHYEALKKRNFGTLKILRRSKGFTLEGLAEVTGISPSYISRLECGARRLNTDLLKKLSSALECAPEDLIRGTLTSVTSQPPRTRIPRTEIRSHDTRNIPVYTVTTGIGTLNQNAPAPQGLETPAGWEACPTQLLDTDNAFGLMVADNGYAPKYNTGDILYVDPNKPLTEHCPVLVLSNNNQTALKCFVRWQKDAVAFLPFDTHQEKITAKSEIKSIYRIVGCWYA